MLLLIGWIMCAYMGIKSLEVLGRHDEPNAFDKSASLIYALAAVLFAYLLWEQAQQIGQMQQQALGALQSL